MCNFCNCLFEEETKMENEKKDRSAVEIAVERGIKSITEQHVAAVPLQTPGPNSVLVPDGKRAGSEIRRLCAFIHAAQKILEDKVRAQFPELGEKQAVFYEGWLAGSEQSGAEVAAEVKAKTGDLFNPSGHTETRVPPRSTRSDNVNVGAVRASA